ncbi:hypothetical protein IFM89_017110 [Coptis chinensis]|uniref:tRNA-binding domain-containing protein n=1 Tax=Coptis chinensis TaxID=261450 RepID=A0A835LQI3_9MAGN|nr:hypothetical protein IFM89_017110 [Coptis chinensis]
MMSTFNEDDEWVRNVRLDACPDEESNCFDTETDICVEPVIVNLENIDTSDGESEGEDEPFEEGDKNEREEVGGCDKEDMNSFNQPGARENGEGTDCEDENAIMFSMRFKTSDEAYDFYNEYAKFVGFSVRRGIHRFNKDVEHKRRFLCSCEGPSINLNHLGKCARTADLSEEEKIHSTSAAPEVSITTLDIRVGIITDVKKHPDVDSLYVQEIDVAEETPRTVVSSLVKYIPLEEMQNRKVCVLCNLKPVKMRGIQSHAMVLATSNDDHTKVELVDPPYSVPVGERVKFPGFQGEPINGYVNLNVFEKLQADLHTDMELVACYKDAPFTTSTGVCKIGVMVMVHGDDKSLVLPPKVASIQVIVVLVPYEDADMQVIFDVCSATVETLSNAGVRAEKDIEEDSPSWKYSQWEMKGRGDTSVWRDTPEDKTQKAKMNYLEAYNEAAALASNEEKKRTSSDADLVDKYNITKSSKSLVEKHQEESANRRKRKSKQEKTKEKDLKEQKEEEWVGKHPWKPWDREKDLTAGRQNVNLDSENMVKGLSSRFSGWNVQRNFL